MNHEHYFTYTISPKLYIYETDAENSSAQRGNFSVLEIFIRDGKILSARNKEINIHHPVSGLGLGLGVSGWGQDQGSKEG